MTRWKLERRKYGQREKPSLYIKKKKKKNKKNKKKKKKKKKKVDGKSKGIGPKK